MQMLPAGSDPATILADERADGVRRLRLGGRLTISNISGLDRALLQIEPDRAALEIDIAAVVRVDTTGAWILHRTVRDWVAAGGAARITGARPEVTALIDRIAAADRPCRMRPTEVDGLTRTLGMLGRYFVHTIEMLGGFLAFLGVTLLAILHTLPRPRRWRVNAVVHQGEAVMVHALGIVGLMSFLVGLVIAQQGAIQLKQFGAEIYTVNLVGRGTLRELGVLMTAIMVAGRSGSAFAAQIGAMKLGEEVDALRTIGLSPIEVLVVPRMLALVFTMPLLAFFAAVCALIGGGLFTYVDFGMPPVTYVQRLQETVPMTDFWITLIKAPVFGVVIAITGCFQGMQVEGNAESVGERTTAAVVQSIFLVIVLDAFFAVFFSTLGWI